MNTKVKIETINLFYHVPFPVVSISLGIGYGLITPKTKVIKTVSNIESEDSTEFNRPVTETFIHIGLPYFNIFDFHIGYHTFSTTEITRNEGNLVYNETNNVDGIKFEEKNYSGSMMTVGVAVAF